MTETPDPRHANEDAARAIRFMVIKVAIFILIPAIAAGLIVWLTLG